MRVFKREVEKEFHLVLTTRWDYANPTRLATYMVQTLCQDRAWPVIGKYAITPLTREHIKKLCKQCELKAKKSSRYGKSIVDTDDGR